MNVLFIETDQLSAKWLGCYGNCAAHTPHLDRLAVRGVRFENCFSNLPVCMPARASTITGRSAQHHGVPYNSWELGLDLPTLPQVLQQNGVQTFGVGKFHLECHGRDAYNDVTKYGFDRAATTEDIRVGDWLDWVEQEHPDCYEQALATCWPMPHTAEYGPTQRDLRAEILAAKQKHPPREATHITYPSLVPEEVCQTKWTVDRGIGFLADRDRDRPFFLKVSFVDPHAPYDPPERFLDFIDPDQVPAPIVPDESTAQVLAKFDDLKFVQRFKPLTTDDWRTMRRYYFASTTFVDEQVGRLLAYLDDQGLADDTLVVFTADHGDMMGDHGLPTKGAWHLDACMRVPLIVAGPAVQQGAAVEQVVANLDLFPTVTDYCEADHNVPLEGLSLRPLLEDSGLLDRPNAALVETYGSYADTSPSIRSRSVATPEARLTLFGDGTGLLFDARQDPDETTNLLGRPEARELESRMKDTMLDLVACQYVPLPSRNRHPTALH